MHHVNLEVPVLLVLALVDDLSDRVGDTGEVGQLDHPSHSFGPLLEEGEDLLGFNAYHSVEHLDHIVDAVLVRAGLVEIVKQVKQEEVLLGELAALALVLVLRRSAVGNGEFAGGLVGDDFLKDFVIVLGVAPDACGHFLDDEKVGDGVVVAGEEVAGYV